MPTSRERIEGLLARMQDPEFLRQFEEEQRIRKEDPFSLSSLPYWLKLETWSYVEGLYLLAGLDPKTVEEDLFSDFAEFIDALPLGEHEAFLLDPTELCSRDEWPGSDESYESFLQAGEKKIAVLNEHRRVLGSLVHILGSSIKGLGDPAISNFNRKNCRYTPKQFLDWAISIDFKPAWYEWAKSKGYLPETDSPYIAPFFDPESDDYPELLHIAVRAWEHARKQSGGTPKKRIADFVAERYPHVSEGARESIALIANWQKAGGRPRTGG